MTLPAPSSLECISNRELLDRLRKLLARDGELEAELLAHLAEVDRRKLYLEEGYPSMFAYCTEALHLAESAAYYRIRAARLTRSFPLILARLRAGEVHLSGLCVLAPHLTEGNHRELLDRASHRSKREIERIVADLAPAPAEPPRVRWLPRPLPEKLPLLKLGLAPRTRPVHPEPLGRERFRVQLTIERETHDKLREAQALLRHQIPDGDLAAIFDRALEALLRKVKRKKFALTSRPRAPRDRPGPSSRHIPSHIRRAVYERDAGCCTYESPSGRRCGARELLEFQHVAPWARTRRHSLDNIVLLCRAHNQQAAMRDFGEAHMQRFLRA